MYVGHVVAGIASMCHRGNHAGNAEAHLTTLPPCIYLPPAIPYIFTVSVLPQTVLSLSLFLPPLFFLSLFFSFSFFFSLSLSVFRFPFSSSPLLRHVLQRNSRDAEIRTRKYGKLELSSHSNNASVDLTQAALCTF